MDVRRYVKQHANGTYYVRKHLGTNRVTGKKAEAYHTLAAKTLPEAEREAAAYLANLSRNPLVPEALDRYICAKERGRSPVNTVAAYRTRARYLEPYFASIRVRDLTTANVTDAYLELLDHGKRDGEPLSGTTVRAVGAFLSGAYRWLISQGYATENPTQEAMLPPKDTREVEPFDESDVALLLELLGQALGDDATDQESAFRRNAAMAATVTLYTGLRVGEVCGLARRDVHTATQSPYVHVSGTVVVGKDGAPTYQPKTKGKRTRNVAIEAALVAALRAHVSWQALLFDARGGSVPVVSVGGGYVSPWRVSSVFRDMALAAGLPRRSHFHMLRHTHATLLLQSGEDVNTVSERLGHASPSTTLNIYGHVLPGRDRAAAHNFDGLLEGLRGGL